MPVTGGRQRSIDPLHEETLQKVDSKAKIVYVTLPDGLLDIYLS